MPEKKKPEKNNKRLKVIDRLEYEHSNKPYADLIQLLSVKSKADIGLARALSDLPINFVALIISRPFEYTEAQLATLRYFITHRKMSGIYITVNKPYESIHAALEAGKVDVSGTEFIDLVSEMSGCKILENESCTYLESASALTELLNLLDSKIPELKSEQSFIVVDSISTLLIYNDSKEVEKFIHLLIGRAREHKVSILLLAIKTDEQSAALQTISQFCDKVEEVIF